MTFSQITYPTFLVPMALADKFDVACKQKGLKRAAAIREAMEEWCSFVEQAELPVEKGLPPPIAGGICTMKNPRRVSGFDLPSVKYEQVEAYKRGYSWRKVMDEALDLWLASKGALINNGKMPPSFSATSSLMVSAAAPSAPVSPEAAPVVELTAEELAEANRVKWEEQHKTWLAKQTQQRMETAAFRFSKGYKPIVFCYVPDWLPPSAEPWKDYGLHDSPVAPWERSSPWTDEMELAVFGYDGRNPEDWPDVWDCKAEVKRREAAERARKQAEADAAELEEV